MTATTNTRPSRPRLPGRWFPADPTGFPGRRLGGAAMIAAPLLLLAGVLLRYEFDFFYPDQLAAYQAHPGQVTTAYGLFALGCALGWPAVAALAAEIGHRHPGGALWGGTLVITGLTARVFHAGMDTAAFRLVDAQGLDAATEAVTAGYATPHVFQVFNTAIMIGWIVLAICAWRSRALGRIGAVALAMMSALPLGVLKGSTVWSLVATAGLCVALLPKGVGLLREAPAPKAGTAARWLVLAAAVVAVMALLGTAGLAGAPRATAS